jgi:SWI/SNF-related matrix-associated actin-dependent regulator of chromatin subfamily A-like protein 1
MAYPVMDGCLTLLKPFQHVGAQFLAERTRALLADEPGVGKTAQVVMACTLVGARRVLVVCPAVGIAHWHREFKRWGEGLHTLPEVTVISYDTARSYYKQGLSVAYRWDVIVVDESHYAKNVLAQRAHAIFGLAGLAYQAKYIWCLSGTPAPNNASELYPMLKAFGVTPMGYEAFTRYFCRVDHTGKVRGTNPVHVEELRDMMKSYVLRRKKSDVLPELGAIDIQEWYVDPSTELLAGGWLEELDEQEGALRAALVNKSTEEILTYLAGDQEFSTLRRINALLKAPAVFNQVMFELDNGLLDKVVIYGYHREPLEILERKFDEAGIGAVAIHGGTLPKYRDGLVEDWKDPRGSQVMLASIIAAGVVLDFSAAHQGIMLELDWVPGNNAQAMQRMHRQGQDKPVTVRCAIGSPVDELVSNVVLRKTRELSKLFC